MNRQYIGNVISYTPKGKLRSWQVEQEPETEQLYIHVLAMRSHQFLRNCSQSCMISLD